MRRLVLLIFLICFGLTSVAIPSSAFAQDRDRRKPPQEGQEREREKKATPRDKERRERPKQEEPRQREPERRRKPSRQEPRAGSRDHDRKPPSREGRAVPRPPQKYIPGRGNYQKHYHYNGRWSDKKPRFYQYRHWYKNSWRIFYCQPGYVIFVGYDYWGNPIFDYVRGCNVPWHHHDYYFQYGY